MSDADPSSTRFRKGRSGKPMLMATNGAWATAVACRSFTKL